METMEIAPFIQLYLIINNYLLFIMLSFLMISVENTFFFYENSGLI